jgi:pimeloyl-ACP methyl ester carboxylesterase
MNPPTDQAKAERPPLIDLPGYGVVGHAEWLAVNWRDYLRTAMIEGRDVNYLQFGDPAQPTAVLIHGLAGCWQNWLANIVELSRSFHVVALDLPGFGHSDLPADGISIPGYADTVAGLMDHLGVEKAHLIGNSMGGMVSAQFAISHPTRVERMILVSPAGWSTSDTPASVSKFAAIGGLISARIGANREFITRRPKLRARVMRGVVAYPEKLSPEITYEVIGATGKRGFAQALVAILGYDLRDKLTSVETPTLVIWGRWDGVISWRDAYKFGDALPNSEVIVLSETAHVAMVEHPEWFDRTATEFLLAS